MSSKPQDLQRGFTLVELMVTLSIVAILGLLAAPSLQSFVAKIRMNGISSQFTGNLLRARSEAVNRNACTVMCTSSTSAAAITSDSNGLLTAGPTCDTATNDWQSGWIVFFKEDCVNDTSATNSKPAKPEDYIAVQAVTGSGYRLDATGTAPVRKFFFSATGRPDNTASASFSLYYKSATDPMTLQFGQNICVDSLGRTRTISRSQTC